MSRDHITSDSSADGLATQQPEAKLTRPRVKLSSPKIRPGENGTIESRAGENWENLKFIAAMHAGENRLLRLLTAGRSLEELLDFSVRVIEEQSNEMLCSILLLDKDQMHLRHGAAPSLPEEYNRAVNGLPIGPSVGSCGTAAHLRERVVVQDISTDPLWSGFREMAAGHGLAACWSQPIISAAGDLLGTFAMYYRRQRSPSEGDILLIEQAAHLAAMVIERKRAEAALRDSEKQFRELADHNRRLVREVDHRVRNNLYGLLGLISLLEKNETEVKSFASALSDRLLAMAHVHQLLADVGWQKVKLQILIPSSLANLRRSSGHAGEIRTSGSDISVAPGQAQALSMILAEWFTNSCKYGSQSVPEGRLDIHWEMLPGSPARAQLTWKEYGGPPIGEPGAPSLGTELVRGLVANELRGECSLTFSASGALHVIKFPL